VMSHWLGEVWIRIRDSFVFLLPLFRSKNRVCLSRGMQVVGVAWCAAMRTMAGVGDLVQRTEDGRTARILGSRAVKRSGRAVRGLHLAREDEERGFLGWALKPRLLVCEWFDLKTTRTVFTSLTSKPVETVSPGLASKSAAGFLVEPQNQGGGGFPGLVLKTGSSGLVIWASKLPRRFLGLGLKTKQTSVCWLRYKTDGWRENKSG
jgi:hypothetical protein